MRGTVTSDGTTLRVGADFVDTVVEGRDKSSGTMRLHGSEREYAWRSTLCGDDACAVLRAAAAKEGKRVASFVWRAS